MSKYLRSTYSRALCAMLVALIGLSGIGVIRLAAQAATATILGTITDTSGAVIAGAMIQVKNVGTGVTQATNSDAQGRFRVPELIVGDYEVTASKSGFSTLVHRGITLTVGAQSVVDFALPVGQQQQTVQVEGQVSQVNTTNAAVGSLIDQTQMRELPLNGRDFEQLMWLAPGMQVITSMSPLARQGAEPDMSAAGARPEGQAILLDDEDLSNLNKRGLGDVTGSSLGIEAIAEFQTLTNTYGAQFGGNGVVINSVSKSGTNDFHGTAYEFLRNSYMDARTFIDAGSSPPEFRRNQFGGSLGGPIKKDKMFFFANYEGIRQLLGESAIATVPTANNRTPSFAEASNPTEYNAIVNTMALLPFPTFNINPTAGTGQLTEVASEIVHEDYVLARWDYTLSDKDSILVRFVADHQFINNPFPPQGSAVPLWAELDKDANYFNTAEWRRIISPTMVNTARVSFSRPNTITASGSPQTPVLQFFPASSGRLDGSVDISGLTNIGPDPYVPALQVQNKFTEGDDLLWTRGAHTLRFGAAVLREDSNVFQAIRDGGQWSFPSLAVFLAGGNAQTTVTGTPVGPQYDFYRDFREIDFTPYFQDDWKATSKLTLNLGVRWEFESNPVDAHNALEGVPNYQTSTSFVTIPHVFLKNPSLPDLEPRFGFAYDPFADHKTSIRGGFAITYSPYFPGQYNGAFGSAPPSEILTQSAPTYPTPFTAITPSAVTWATGFAPQNDVTPYLLQYNLNVQREISQGTVLSIGYVGSHGVHELTLQDQNPPEATIDSNGVYHFGEVNSAGTLVENPRLNPNFGFLVAAVPGTTSRYNSMQVTLNRRLTHNLAAQVAYTWSRCIDDGGYPIGSLDGGSSTTVENPYLRDPTDKGLCYFNISQSLRVNFLYPLPFHGNRFKEGWQFSGIFSGSTGLPDSINTGFDRVGYSSSGTPRPNYVEGCQVSVGKVQEWFNPQCFSLQAAGTLGNEGRDTLYGPSNVDMDLALLKDTRINERTHVQFRGELFNIFNHPNLGLPNTSVFTASGPNPTAGQITTQVGNARQVQVALKLIF